MPQFCAECGAALPESGSCRDYFHQLLFLESEVPNGPGRTAHFYAVASYGIQHPESMGFTVATVAGLRRELASVIAGRNTTEDVRRTVGERARDAGRITRRDDDPVPQWPIETWPMTIADVLDGAAPGEYCQRVERWARSIALATEGIRLDGEGE